MTIETRLRLRSDVASSGLLLICILAPAPAQAYLLDTTDALTIPRAELQLELQPLGLLLDRDHVDYQGSLSLYYGIVDRWDMTLQARPAARLDGSGTGVLVRDIAFYTRVILVEGSLQDRDGPSLAIQIGALAPDVGLAGTSGAEALLALSHAWPSATVHLNVGISWRDGEALSISEYVLLSGPRAWPTRPVIETVATHTAAGDHTLSTLVGFEHDADDTTLELGARVATTFGDAAPGGGGFELEVRAAVAWGIDVGPRAATGRPR